MKRRAVLASGATVALAGCLSLLEPEESLEAHETTHTGNRALEFCNQDETIGRMTFVPVSATPQLPKFDLFPNAVGEPSLERFEVTFTFEELDERGGTMEVFLVSGPDLGSVDIDSGPLSSSFQFDFSGSSPRPSRFGAIPYVDDADELEEVAMTIEVLMTIRESGFRDTVYTGDGTMQAEFTGDPIPLWE